MNVINVHGEKVKKIILVFRQSVRTNSTVAGLLQIIRDSFFRITINLLIPVHSTSQRAIAVQDNTSSYKRHRKSSKMHGLQTNF